MTTVAFDLGGDEWEVTDLTTRERRPAAVPGCVHLDLLRAGTIDDPFWRENEAATAWIGDRDWRYARSFDVPDEVFERRHQLLRFSGLDTLAEVTLNGRSILTADNMHRRWDVDVTSLLRREGNELEVTFASANAEIRRRQSERRLPGWYGISSIEGAGWLRKQLSNFGWDWGPSLVTAGIWRRVELIGWDDLLVTDVVVSQRHGDGAVGLDVRVETSPPLPAGLLTRVELRDPDGQLVSSSTVVDDTQITVDVHEPRLWWPNGLGDQPLYRVDVSILRHDGSATAEASRRIGLRALRLVRAADADGETFGFECTGVPFFAKGANWIPADAVVARPDRETLRRLVFDAAAANMNMLRVWGGGIYEEDDFYDACDEAGICIWQDAAFACVTFPSFDADYVASVRGELADNIRRLRHHPSLALWCGNNELEMGLVGDAWNDWQMPWDDYVPFMDGVVGDVVRTLDPDRDYWPGSPHTPGDGRRESNSPSAGDAHLWTVWHGGQPGTWYRTSTHRFVSEFGFQAYPHPATMAAVTEPADRDLGSPAIDARQKATAAGASGNAELARQLVQHFRTPGSWDGLIWQTQLLQALTVTTGLEHWRRSMNRTRGTLYWQLNDCWPGPSWSSVDYFGHWKALHYSARRAFAPVMLSLVEDNVKLTVDVHVTNETRDAVTVPVEWTVMRTDGLVLAAGVEKATVDAQADRRVLTVDAAAHVTKHGRREVLVFVAIPDLPEQRAMTAFAPIKHLLLQDPELAVAREGHELTVVALRPAPWVWLDAGGEQPLRLSDNFFAMLPGTYTVSAQTLPSQEIRVLSVLDTLCR